MVVFNRQINLYNLTNDAHRSGDGWLDIKGITQVDTDGTTSSSNKIGLSTGTTKNRIVVQIKLPTFPYDDANAEITDLKLNLFCHNVQNDWADNITVYRITKNVRMSNVSWTEYSDTNGENLTWTTAGATGGDLSSGTVCASSSDITSSGYEQSYYNSMTINSADVDAGKVILFTFRADSVNSDYTINATVKYHLR